MAVQLEQQQAATDRDAGGTSEATQERNLQRALAGLGGLHAATGALALLAPGVLFDTIDGFGVENDHFIRHVGTIDLALGGILLVSAKEPRWRLPSLAAATTQSALHLAVHLFDTERPNPRWVEYLDDALIGGVTGLLAWCLVRTRRLERARGRAS
ncbi:MAG: hypothetical protein M3R23_02905 [Actinomycetota bacterium]|nr:hypothetical protein [Actinomycetota bacterium]